MTKAQVLLNFIDEVSLLPSGTPGLYDKRRVKEHEFSSAMDKFGRKKIIKKKEGGGVESYYYQNNRVGYTEKKRGKPMDFWLTMPKKDKSASTDIKKPMPFRGY